jgi:hypothetical protein
MTKILLEIEVPDYLSDSVSTDLKWERARELAERAFSPDWIIDTWHISDVYEVRDDLDSNQAQNVLKHVFSERDANIGISYEVIEDVADNLYPRED